MDTESTAEALNDLLEKDPEAVESLLDSYVRANQELAEDEDVVVSADSLGSHNTFLGGLGFLNGLLSKQGDRYVVAVYDDGEISHFRPKWDDGDPLIGFLRAGSKQDFRGYIDNIGGVENAFMTSFMNFTHPSHQRVVVYGPEGFLTSLYDQILDALQNELDAETQDVTGQEEEYPAAELVETCDDCLKIGVGPLDALYQGYPWTVDLADDTIDQMQHFLSNGNVNSMSISVGGPEDFYEIEIVEDVEGVYIGVPNAFQRDFAARIIDEESPLLDVVEDRAPGEMIYRKIAEDLNLSQHLENLRL